MNLGEKFEKRMRHLADLLNSASNRLSLQSQKRIVILLGIVMACICTEMIMDPFRRPFQDLYRMPVEYHTPVTVVPPDSLESVLSQQDYKMLLDFKHTMDSLKTDDPTSYEQILQGRESLMDSIDFLIRIYQ